MKRYLVTGCAGFIGSHLVQSLLARGDQVLGIDSFTDYYPRVLKERNLDINRCHDSLEFQELDLAVEDLGELVATVDGVFHLAAQAGVRGSWGDAFAIYLRDNLMATQRIFEAAWKNGCRVVFASSSSIYGDASTYPTRESLQGRPISPYGVTKLSCEHLAQGYAHSAGLDFVALRYFTVYGERQRPEMAFSRIFAALLGGDQFNVYGDGRQSRDVTYVGDAVQATLQAMDGAPSGAIYNIGGGSETSLLEVIDLAERLSGQRLNVEFGSHARGDVRRTAGDTKLIRKELGWRPATALEQGLAAQFEWTAAQYEWTNVSSGSLEEAA